MARTNPHNKPYGPVVRKVDSAIHGIVIFQMVHSLHGISQIKVRHFKVKVSF